MKLPIRILLSVAMILGLIGASVADSHISTEVIQPGKVERVATSLNHVTIIQLPEPVVSISIGSNLVRVEYHDNRVLIEPTKPNVSTNLFVWTATSHSVYEIMPAGDPGKMSYMLDQVFPVPPPPPDPSPEEMEKQTDTMYTGRAGNLSPDPERQVAAMVSISGTAFGRGPKCKDCVQMRVTRVAEDSDSYYIYVVAENTASTPIACVMPPLRHCGRPSRKISLHAT